MPFDSKTGDYICEGCGGSFAFLPARSAESAPYEFIHSACGVADPRRVVSLEAVAVHDDQAHAAAQKSGTQSPNRHHLVDPQAVADWYEANQDGFAAAGSKQAYIDASQAHAAKVERVKAGAKIDPRTGEPVVDEPPVNATPAAPAPQ